MNAESILSALDPNAQSDGENEIIVVDGPQMSSAYIQGVQIFGK